MIFTNKKEIKLENAGSGLYDLCCCGLLLIKGPSCEGLLDRT